MRRGAPSLVCLPCARQPLKTVCLARCTAVVDVAQPDYLLYAAVAEPPSGATAWVAPDGVPAAAAAAAATAAVRRRVAAQSVAAGSVAAAAAAASEGDVSAQSTPNDASWSSLWHLPKVSAPGAWETTTGSNSVRWQHRTASMHGVSRLPRHLCSSRPPSPALPLCVYFCVAWPARCLPVPLPTVPPRCLCCRWGCA